MQVPEFDPTKGIVDIDTFILHLVGYRSEIVTTRPSQWHTILSYPPGQHFAPPDNPRPNVSLHEFPWQDTPQSIQDVIKLQYPAASVDEEKRISLWLEIPKGCLRFTLNSTSIVNGFRGGFYLFDKYGKVVIPTEGLILSLRDGESAAPKGSWYISQRPANTAEIKFIKSGLATQEYHEQGWEATEDKIFRAMEKMMKAPIEAERASMQPATLQELHDIIRILEKGKEQTTWGETLY